MITADKLCKLTIALTFFVTHRNGVKPDGFWYKTLLKRVKVKILYFPNIFIQFIIIRN